MIRITRNEVFIALGAVFAPALFFTGMLFLLQPRFNVPYSFVLYDSANDLLGASVAADGQWRLPPRPVPHRAARALLVFEDKRFYYHPGIDPLSIIRAIRDNLVSGTVVSGGSTITMQTARLALGNQVRTMNNKLKEAVCAVSLEVLRSKKDILTLYASHAPFGGNVVGLEAASWRYYGRGPDDLTWAEAATLAVLPNQPSLVHPGADRERLLAKRNRLLHALYEEGDIDSQTLELSLLEALPGKPLPLPRHAPHLLERLKNKGVTNTDIDRRLQITVSSMIDRWSRRFQQTGIYNGGAMIIETKTGKVIAYVGNVPSAQKNQDVDVVSSKRSSGSILKPFLYAVMLDAGLLLRDQLVIDIPTRIGSYRPENNLPVYRGVIPASEALSRSLNIPFIRMLREYGIEPFLQDLQKAGFTTLTRSADEYGLPLILGGGEITLEEGVAAFAAVMNTAAAYTQAPLSVSPANRPYSRGSAYITLDVLSKGVRPEDEGLWQRYASAQRIAWKTGTSYGNRDAWAIGVTSEYTVGVWFGNASGEGTPALKSVSTSAPVLFDIFSILPRAPWPSPPIEDLEQVTVCSRSGYLAGPACSDEKIEYKPRNARASECCPYCRVLSLTVDGSRQATAQDMQGELPRTEKRFVLPAHIERFYGLHDLTYRKAPPWIDGHAGGASASSLSIVFPEEGSRVYIPTEIDGSQGSMIAVAAHSEGNIVIYWDLDGEYLGDTKGTHEIALTPGPGKHVLTVTDSRGNRSVRRFEHLRE